jgi:dTDP-4-amino-4,6-dideoxygalactose transaminase
MKNAVATARKPTVPNSTKPVAVPMLDLSRQYTRIQAEITTVVQQVCASQQYILGPEVAKFEQEAATFLGAAHGVACASGTDAIWLSLVAAGVEPGHEVLTTPFSFFATASAIVRAGARPVFADVDATNLNLDPAAVRARIEQSPSPRLKAMMPVHLYGQCADMTGLQTIADEHKLAMVEDAAQAFGAAWRGKRAGSLGEIAAFSFYPTKNLSCYGDGGLVTTNDAARAEHVKKLRNHGSSQRYYHDEIGWNSRLDSIQAAILRVKLKHIEDWNRKRRERAEAYDLLFKTAGLLSPLGTQSTPKVRLLADSEQSFHIYHQYVIRVQKRDELRALLTERKIGSEVYYPVPLHLQKCFAYLGYGEGSLPVSERAAREVLALPIFPEIAPEEQSAVVSAIADFYS